MYKNYRYLTSILVGALSIAASQQAWAQCSPCPANATDTAVGIGLAAFRINPDGSTGPALGTGTAGSCQKIRLRMSLSYVPIGPSGNPTVAFSGGHMVIVTTSGSFSNDVTPVGGVVKIAPLSETLPGGCAPGGTNFLVSSFTSDYVISAHSSDIVGGVISFEALYGTNGTIAYFCPPITNETSGSTPIQVHVAAPPTCSISPPTNIVCAGGTASFTVTPTGDGPFTVSWTGPNGFTSTNSFTITIPNAQAANAGIYTSTVYDSFGCPSSCTAILIVNPNPTITFNSPSVCAGGSAQLCAIVNTSVVGPVSYLWNTGDTTPCITKSPAATSNYTVVVTTTNGCSNTNTGTITINPSPSCSIIPQNATNCIGTCREFTVTVTGGAPPYVVAVNGPGVAVTNRGVTTSSQFSGCASNTPNTYLASITDSNGCTSSCSTTLYGIPCTPKICVTKEVACYLGTNAPEAPLSSSPVTGDEHCGVFSNSATGVSGNTDPAFCYSITISNCGNVNLTNVTVVDNQFGDLTANFFPGGPSTIFASGSPAITYIFKATVPQDLTNTVTTVGQSVFDGSFVTNTSQAVVTVIPAAVQCTKHYTVDGGALTNDVTLTDSNPHTILWYVTVSNPSSLVNLGSVVVTDLSGDLPCGPFTVPPFSLPAGGSTNILVCSNSVSCTNGFEGITNSVSVVATDFTLTNGTPVCGIDINNTNIVVTSECSATLLCGQPAACRVTGGGRQDMPNVFPANVRYVTHGGQVGAPVGDRICVVTTQFPIGNPCIHGRWTHVRHMQGGLEGNFHARFYDTLQCACLDTSVTSAVVTLSGVDGVSAQTYTNLVYGPGTLVDTVCNPGNRIAGPEPSPAPANKIVFTGIGDYALTEGNRVPVSVLFRVDIEDRGEPGGSHPLGGKPPPDRNRTRIWILTPTELAELRGGPGDSLLLTFRNAISACNGINVQDGASVPNGTAAFGVRAPDIDDGGELDRGNYQIHPSILNCDPNNPVGPGLAKP